MKSPTTEFDIENQKQIQINRDFLISQGWELKEEYPLFENFTHPKNHLVYAAIGIHGEFSICEVHWCNGNPEREFNSLNPELTTDDYFNILKMLRIKL
jgi:hypothetical protein